jgi:hypothetical protein
MSEERAKAALDERQCPPACATRTGAARVARPGRRLLGLPRGSGERRVGRDQRSVMLR